MFTTGLEIPTKDEVEVKKKRPIYDKKKKKPAQTAQTKQEGT
mgnify:CR=1 FL=1